MKKFFRDFKAFISRGNVMDLAVGMIIGTAFTAIVTALSEGILKPLINYVLALIFGEGAMTESFTFLKQVFDDTGAIDLANSIYIDWGGVINAVINFLIIAFVLFVVIKFVNSLHKKPAEPEAPAEPTTKVCPYFPDLFFHRRSRKGKQHNQRKTSLPGRSRCGSRAGRFYFIREKCGRSVW